MIAMVWYGSLPERPRVSAANGARENPSGKRKGPTPQQRDRATFFWNYLYHGSQPLPAIAISQVVGQLPRILLSHLALTRLNREWGDSHHVHT